MTDVAASALADASASSAWRFHTEPVRDARHALELLDDVDSVVRFCSAYMPDVARHYRGSEAMWRVAHWIAGQASAAPIAADVEHEPRIPHRGAAERSRTDLSRR